MVIVNVDDLKKNRENLVLKPKFKNPEVAKEHIANFLDYFSDSIVNYISKV
jgi:hypothetical protein